MQDPDDIGRADTLASDRSRAQAGSPTDKVPQENAPGEEALLASSRFEVRRTLGSGAFGVVYNAFDRQRQVPIALKTLHLADPRRLYSLKQEFRKLADVSHTNLVNLYELGVEKGAWFIAMELVDGVEFTDWVRPPRNHDDPSPPLDLARLRDALRGLVAGVQALHGQGILHCDLKPSNVLVTRAGRVVILDFGLVASQDTQSGGPGITGTPEYMSPEQAVGDRELTPASDWYAVGSMLYRALAGRLPFQGPMLEVLLAKSSRDPTPVSKLNPDVPADLGALCCSLMDRDPSRRPTGSQLLDQLGIEAEEARASGARTGEETFVGRSKELAQLRECARTAPARTTTVFVVGPSGIGKSSLVRQFLFENSALWPNTIVLSGRCFAQESVPYKGLDGVIDSLHGALLELSEDQRARVVPSGLPSLVRAFPILADLRPDEPGMNAIPDEQELKLRVMWELRSLFQRLAELRPVIVAIDDVQWADPDSVALLSELLRPPGAPLILVIAMYRSEDAASSPLLAELRDTPHFRSGDADVVDIEVGALPAVASRALAEDLVREAQLESQLEAGAIEVILAESAGEPFLIQEYIRLAAAGIKVERRDGLERRAAIDAMLAGRIERLPAEAKKLLEVIAVAGVPVNRQIACQAAGIGDGAARVLKLLRAHSMVRRLGAPLENYVEAYHDRIREVAAGAVPQVDLKGVHDALGTLLERAEGTDAETLMVHFAAADKHVQATRYALAAAEQASRSLAFDHAATLYEKAVELGEVSGTQQLDMRVALADAYRNAGQLTLAARAYLDAARRAQGELALKLKSQAGAHYLQCGRMREGLEICREVLEAVGERMPRTRIGAMIRLLWLRGRLWLRGLKYSERLESDLPARDLLRLETCYEVSTTLSTSDEIVASVFAARYLLHALDAGEPRHVSLAMGIESCFLAVTGASQSRRVINLMLVADVLAKRLDTPFTTASVLICRGVVTWSEGRFVQALAYCQEANKLFTEQCVGVPWDKAISRFYTLYCQLFAGHLGDLVRAVPEYLAEAEACGDLNTQSYLRHFFAPFALLVQDRPDEVDAELEAAAEMREERFQTHHWWALASEAQCLLYDGDGLAAYALVRGTWGKMSRALTVLSISCVRVEALTLRARAAIAAAYASSSAGERTRMLRRAARDAKKVGRHPWAWAKALAQMLDAGVAVARGRTQGAGALFAAAEHALTEARLPIYATCCKRYRGVVVGGDSGHALIVAADVELRAEAVVAPKRFARMLLDVRPTL